MTTATKQAGSILGGGGPQAIGEQQFKTVTLDANGLIISLAQMDDFPRKR